MSQATAAFGNVDEATKQAAAPIIRKLGFRFDGENVKLAELLSDLRKFYSAHPLAHDRELTRSDGLSDLVGAKYWGLTARSHLVELAPYWPDDLIRKQICRLFTLLAHSGVLSNNDIQVQQISPELSSQIRSSAPLHQDQRPSDMPYHEFLVGASLATQKQKFQGQLTTCHGLPTDAPDQSTEQTIPIPSPSEELRESIQVTPAPYNREATQARPLESPKNISKPTQPTSNGSKPSKRASQKSNRQSNRSSLQDVHLNPSDIISLARARPARVNITFADIHANFPDSFPPCAMQHKPSSKPGTEYTVVIADADGDKPVDGRMATVKSYRYAPLRIILILRFDESHSYIVKSFAGNAHRGRKFYRGLGPNNEFADLPSAYELNKEEVALRSHYGLQTSNSHDSPVNDVDDDGESDVSIERPKSSSLGRLGRHAYDTRAYFKALSDVGNPRPSETIRQSTHQRTQEEANLTLNRKKEAPRRKSALPPTPATEEPTPDPPAPSSIPSMKREHSSSEGAPAATRQRRQRSLSVEEIDAPQAPLVDQWKQARTKLNFVLSTNEDGKIPAPLNHCMSMNAFISKALAVWGLQEKADEVAAISVSFDWLKDEIPIVVTRAAESSFHEMLETINEADCWNQLGNKAKCNVYVRIRMR